MGWSGDHPTTRVGTPPHNVCIVSRSPDRDTVANHDSPFDLPSERGQMTCDHIASTAQSASQPTIFFVTNSAASCCTKCPAFGIVISVRSFATQFQVSFSAPGNNAVSLRP